MNLQLECEGPLAGLFVDADTDGNVRGYVRRPNVHFPGDPGRGARAALGGSGFLSVAPRARRRPALPERGRAPRARPRGRPPALVRRERAGRDRARPRGRAARRRAARRGRRRARPAPPGRRRRRDRRGSADGSPPARSAAAVARGASAQDVHRARCAATGFELLADGEVAYRCGCSDERARGRPSPRSGATGVLEVLATEQGGGDHLRVLPVALRRRRGRAPRHRAPARGGRGERVSAGVVDSAPSSGRTHGPLSRRTAIPTRRRGRPPPRGAPRAEASGGRAAAQPAKPRRRPRPLARPRQARKPRLPKGGSPRRAAARDGRRRRLRHGPARRARAAPARAEEGGPRDRLGRVRRGRARPRRTGSPDGSGPTSSSASRRAACSWAARSPPRSAWTSTRSGSRSAGATPRRCREPVRAARSLPARRCSSSTTSPRAARRSRSARAARPEGGRARGAHRGARRPPGRRAARLLRPRDRRARPLRLGLPARRSGGGRRRSRARSASSGVRARRRPGCT